MEHDPRPTANTLRDIAEALCQDDTWPHVETLVRRTVRVGYRATCPPEPAGA